ncbi:MAG: pyridoxal 5'-phosphate synthase glutaminase subunit PdxT [Candidatus Mcinerneyibacterium aminivorans]|uniref:Pyridoxal 5'-phosphate synthase glutaminase subunit PdxT n=1 Tax=Candidatus Mcinerneyibacterium aminivorans TaxID=2703815 RepID=A0A5D0MHE8_9BACT|nr:MAG: pyridoxal 5'-phosphate synthase glutaminase subunit PdxT [Candidatus Mcinerneyibacterium aminivorans]
MKVGILGFQGAIEEHEKILSEYGISTIRIKRKDDFQNIDKLIIPGGESTVMRKFLIEYGLKKLFKETAAHIPVWGICAGSIILSKKVDDKFNNLGIIDVNIKRNAYGRQINSSIKNIDISKLGISNYRGVFIRAPKIIGFKDDIISLGMYEDEHVFLQKDNIMLTTFHPELTDDRRIYNHFLSI